MLISVEMSRKGNCFAPVTANSYIHFKQFFSSINFPSTLLNCFALGHSVFKTKQLRSLHTRKILRTESLTDNLALKPPESGSRQEWELFRFVLYNLGLVLFDIDLDILPNKSTSNCLLGCHIDTARL